MSEKAQEFCKYCGADLTGLEIYQICGCKKSRKAFIGGKEITKKEAFKGLGNPKNWEREKEILMKEFRKKP